MRALTVSVRGLVVACVGVAVSAVVAQEIMRRSTDSQRTKTAVSTAIAETTAMGENVVGGGENVEERSRELVTNAILQLYRSRTVDAAFQIQAKGEFSLSGDGEYRAVWDERGLRFRYVMRFPLRDGTTAMWLQCCDGLTLQTLTDLHGASLRRVQLGQIRNQLAHERRELDARWPGMGGIPKLLWQIGRATSWRSCEQIERPESAGNAWKLTGTLRDDAVRRYFLSCVEPKGDGESENDRDRLSGETERLSASEGPESNTKKSANRQNIASEQNDTSEYYGENERNDKSDEYVGDNGSTANLIVSGDGETARTAETIDRAAMAAIGYLPDQIVLYLDQETLFLCGVEFFHTDSRGRTTPIASLMTTTFSLGNEVDERIFAEIPEGIEAMNVTHSYLESLRNGTF